MVVRVLKTGQSFRPSFEYNVKKLIAGEASIVACRNMVNWNLATVLRTFRELEEGPKVSSKITSLRFHAAVSPGPDDTINEEGVKAMVDEMMTMLGYGNQPYVVFRHNDIEREHYHILSVRVRNDGKSIKSSFEGWAIRNFLKENEKKYGFILGKGGAVNIEEFENLETNQKRLLLPNVPKRFDSNGSDVKRQFITVFDDAMKWNGVDLAQFHAIMSLRGVAFYKKRRRNGDRALIVRGLDEDGRLTTKPYVIESEFGYPAGRILEQRIEENIANRTVDPISFVRTKIIGVAAMNKATSMDGFISLCRSCGLDAVPILKSSTNKLASMVFCDSKRRTVYHGKDFGSMLDAKSFKQKLESGQWTEHGEAQEFTKSERAQMSREIKSDMSRIEMWNSLNQVGGINKNRSNVK